MCGGRFCLSQGAARKPQVGLELRPLGLQSCAKAATPRSAGGIRAKKRLRAQSLDPPALFF